MKEQEFASYMFKKVIDTVVEAGGPDKKYFIPQVRTTRQRTHEDEQEMRYLRSVHFMSTLRVPDEKKDEAARKKMGDKYDQLAAYVQQLPAGTPAQYCGVKNQIILDERLKGTEHGSDIVTRCVLRSARKQMRDEKDTGYLTIEKDLNLVKRLTGNAEPGNYVPAEVLEFFPALSYVLSNEDTRITMDRLLEDEEFFQGNVAVKVVDMFKAYDKGDTHIGDRLRDRLRQSGPYMSLVANLPQMTVERMMIALDLLGHRETGIAKQMIAHAFDDKKIIERSGGDDPYSLAELAVERARPLLEEEWAKVMYMPGEDVDDIFIQPVREELREMKERGFMDRMRIRRSERKMRRMG